MIVSNSINQMFEEMKAWRQELHSIPEIGLEEYETSKYIKSKLSEFNIEFKDGYANTGIVARVKGSQGESDKSIGLRADFDALPMPEKNEFEHKSTNEGMMHACGHDGHTSMLLGAAKYLSENNDFDGSVYFIFQPGEEGFAGGQKMIQDGMFDDFKIDEVYALHNWPELPIGAIGVNSGPMMAAVDDDGSGEIDMAEFVQFMVNLKNDCPSSSIAILKGISAKYLLECTFDLKASQLCSGTLTCALIPSCAK